MVRITYIWRLLTCVAAGAMAAGCMPQLYDDIDKDGALYAYFNQRAPTDYKLTAGAAVADNEILWDVPYGWRACARGKLAGLSPSHLPKACSQPAPPADKNLFVIGISGGGHKAEVFALSVLQELDSYGLRDDIDAIASASGGSFAALFHAVTCDEGASCPDLPSGKPRPVWSLKDIDALERTNVFWPFIGKRLNPYHLWLNATTYHDSGESFVDTLLEYYGPYLGSDERPLTFADLNPERPNLLLTSTNITRDRAHMLVLQGDHGDADEEWMNNVLKANVAQMRDASLHFSFSKKYFDLVKSDLNRYPLVRALVASAAHPSGIDPITLRNYGYAKRGTEPDGWYPSSKIDETRFESFVHLTDGGVFDNVSASPLQWFVECTFKDKLVGTRPRIGYVKPFNSCSPDQKKAPQHVLAATIDVSLTAVTGRDNQQAEQRLAGSGIPLRIGSGLDIMNVLSFANAATKKAGLSALMQELPDDRGRFADFGLDALFEPACLVANKCGTWERAQKMFQQHCATCSHPGATTIEQKRHAVYSLQASALQTTMQRLSKSVDAAQVSFKLTDQERADLVEAAIWVTARRIYEICDGTIDKMFSGERIARICRDVRKG